MQHDTYLPPATEHAQVPTNATMCGHVTDTDPGQVRVELDIVGDGTQRLVIIMSNTLAEARADLDTLQIALDQASRQLAEREVLAAHGLGGY